MFIVQYFIACLYSVYSISCYLTWVQCFLLIETYFKTRCVKIKLVTYRPTDRPTDRQTDIVTYRAAIAAKNIHIQGFIWEGINYEYLISLFCKPSLPISYFTFYLKCPRNVHKAWNRFLAVFAEFTWFIFNHYGLFNCCLASRVCKILLIILKLFQPEILNEKILI